jgi:hypothetical protein
MLLGDLLASFEDDGVAAQTALRLIDLTTLNRMRQHADANGITIGEYAQCAVRRFADGATTERCRSSARWADERPGAVCLQRASAYVTREDERPR